MFIMTLRYTVADEMLMNRLMADAVSLFTEHGAKSLSRYQIASGEHVGQSLVVMRYDDAEAWAKGTTKARSTEQYAAMMNALRTGGNILQETVYLREM